MKNSNYNTRENFESLVARERAREVPNINVRTAVRRALQKEQREPESLQVSDILIEWFSGVRGFIATGLAIASIAALAMIVFTQAGSFSEDPDSQGTDELTAFIDSGDWSILL